MPILTLTNDELRSLHTILGVAMEKTQCAYTARAITMITMHLAEAIRREQAEGTYDPTREEMNFDLTSIDLLHITSIYDHIITTISLPVFHHNIMVTTLHKIRDIAYEQLGATPLN